MPRFAQDYTEQLAPQPTDSLLLCTAEGTVMYATWDTLCRYAQASFSVTPQSVVGLNELLAGRAVVGHTHLIQDVDGLQNALDSKAPSVHSHSVADLTDLSSVLGSKADIDHTHLIQEVDGLQDALDEAAASGGSSNGAGLPKLWVIKRNFSGSDSDYSLGVPEGMDMTGVSLILRRCSRVTYRAWKKHHDSRPVGDIISQNGYLHPTYVRDVYNGGREDVLPGLTIESAIAFSERGLDYYRIRINAYAEPTDETYTNLWRYLKEMAAFLYNYGGDKTDYEYKYWFSHFNILRGERGECAFLLMREGQYISRPLWFKVIRSVSDAGIIFHTT